MKNAIQYYYGLYPVDIHQTPSGFYEFQVNGNCYVLEPFNRSLEELEEIYRISNQLITNRIYCHQIIQNVMGKILTIINQTPYVLLKLYITSKEQVTIYDILFFSNLVVENTEKSMITRNEWKKLWSRKNDYLEYQVNQFGKSFPKIRESFSYFIGLSEIGIALLNETKIEEPLVISHRRTCSTDTMFDLYNPLNFILDYKERDIIEFWKVEILADTFTLEAFSEFLNTLRLTDSEWMLLLARAFYPTVYFDSYEDIIEKHKKEELLEPIIKKVSQYELFLKLIYEKVRYIHPLPDLWLTKSIE